MESNLFKRIADESKTGGNLEEKSNLESYFQTLVENLPGGVAVVSGGKDRTLKPEFITNGFAAMTGMTRDQVWDLYGKDALAGVHPDDRERVSRALKKCLNQGQEQFILVYRLLRGDGAYIWIRTTMSLIRYSDDLFYIYAVYNDITDEHKKQNELREKFYELIRQHYQNPTADTLILGHCNITKNAVLNIVDYTGAGLIKAYGKKRDAFFSGLSEAVTDEAKRKEFLDCFMNEPAIKAFEAGKRKVSLQCFVVIPGEKHGRYAEVNMNLVQAPDSSDIIGVLTVTDITNSIIENKILHNASVLTSDFVLDLDTVEDRYTVLSRHGGAECAPEDSGCHTQRMKYMLENMIVPEDREAYRHSMEPDEMISRLKKEGSYYVVFSIQTDDGRIMTKRINVSPVDLRIGRVCLVRTDITEILAAERESKAALERALAEAKEANHAKSDFLSRMSHDIRTPLNGIIGMTEILLRENSDPRLQADLETVASSGTYLMSLINDILDISRIESGKMELHPAPYMVSSFIKMINGIIRPMMQEKNLTFDCEMRCGLECARLDEVRFNQIFFNLLSNAAKFTPENGHVLFSAVALSSDDKIEMVRFIVKDNGIGMSEEFLGRAFEPFEKMRAAGYGTENRNGAGLGLAIVRELVTMMNGKISVRSKLGEGSEFIVDLPLEKCAMPENEEEKNVSVTDKLLAGKHILLVEDNEINRMVAVRLLEAEQMKVTCAANGKIALDSFAQSPEHTFDAVLMDVRMPVMDGLEATRQIRGLDRADAKTIPIIAMSANAYEEDRQKSIKSGMNDHLSKPVEPEKLYSAIRRYI